MTLHCRSSSTLSKTFLHIYGYNSYKMFVCFWASSFTSKHCVMMVVTYLMYFFYFLLYIKRVLLMSVFHFIHSVWHEYQHRSQRMTLSTKVNNWKKKKCSKNDFRFPNEAWNFWWIWNDKIWASEEVPKEHNVNLKGVCDTTIYINLLLCLNKMLDLWCF